MRRFIAGLLVVVAVVCVFIPSVRFTEDRDTIRLARVLYALGKTESYDTKLALGTVVMNRVENPWFPGDLGDVLRDQQQFPSGTRYDEESLRAAHALLSGERNLPENALYYQARDAAQPWGEANRVDRAGSYNFYSAEAWTF